MFRFFTSLIPFFLGLSVSAQVEKNVELDKYKPLTCSFKDDLITMAVVISASDTLFFYTDTGGKNYLYKSGIKKLNIRSARRNLWNKSDMSFHFTQNGVPQPEVQEIYYWKEVREKDDGMLGREWFAGKVWTFDYEAETLGQGYPSDIFDVHEGDLAKIYFKKDGLGNHMHHLPRIKILVDGDTLPVLFDTGARAELTSKAQEKLEMNSIVATSFIDASTFDYWQRNHPEWEVIAEADIYSEAMIVVPSLAIGNKIVGPVGFVRREDSNFEVMSAIFMDKDIVGAIGGNALSQLKYFTIDYNKEILLIWE